MKYSLFCLFFLIACSSTPKKKDAPSFISKEDRKVIFKSIALGDIKTLAQHVEKIPDQNRSRNDQAVLNKAMAMTVSEGDECNKQMAQYLWDKGARVSFRTIKRFSSKSGNRRVFKMPLCSHNYITKSYLSFLDRIKERSKKEEVKDLLTREYISKTHNNFIKFASENVQNATKENEQQVAKELLKYTKLVVLTLKRGKESCKENRESLSCISVDLYEKTLEQLKFKIKPLESTYLQNKWLKSVAIIEQVYQL